MSSSSSQVKPPPPVSRFVVPLFALGTLLFWSSLYVYVPILPIYAEHLGASLTVVGVVVSAYGLPQLLFRIPIGMLSDRLGRRKPFVLGGLLVASAGAVGYTVVANPWALVALRGVHGVSAAMWVAFTVLFSSYFPAQRAVRAMGLIVFVGGVAQVVATWSGGHIAQRFGWVAPFYVSLGLAALGFLCLLGARDEPRRTRNPLTVGDMVRVGTVPLLLWVSVIAALSQFATYGVSFAFLPVYAGHLGATRADQGNLMSAMLISSTLASLLSAFLSERWGERRVVVIGMLLSALAVAVMPWVQDLFWLTGLHALTGLGRGIGYPLLMGLSVKAVPQSERATAMGVFQAVYALGMFLGPLLAGPMGQALGLGAVFYVTAGVTASAALLSHLKLR